MSAEIIEIAGRLKVPHTQGSASVALEMIGMDIEGLTKLIEQQGSNFARMIEQQNEKFTRMFEQQNETFTRLIEQQNFAISRIEKKVDQISDKVTDIDKRLVAVESQLPHIASKAWVQVTLAVAIAGALGALGSIFTILNTVPKH